MLGFSLWRGTTYLLDRHRGLQLVAGNLCWRIRLYAAVDVIVSTDRTDKWSILIRVRVRTGYWHLHLATIANMLGLFAAAGHHNYATSPRFCLQMMNRLETSHPWLYDQFLLHGHTVRCSDHFWAGVSTEYISPN